MGLIIPGLVILFLICLLWERICIAKQRKKIPLRISVTGTRGKSSVVRMLTSVLNTSGCRTLGKTTGSQACFLLPEGHEQFINRRGPASIIEQKTTLHRAVQIKAECLVAEIMSIGRENHWVESQKILQPHLVIITNNRVDHCQSMGKTRAEMASTYCLDITNESTVFIPEGEFMTEYSQTCKNTRSQLAIVKNQPLPLLDRHHSRLRFRLFQENINLVIQVAQHLQIDSDSIMTGLENYLLDFGAVKCWKINLGDTGNMGYLLNGFAANDPESTLAILNSVKSSLKVPIEKIIGLFNLRSDRADRTQQWINTLKSGAINLFSNIYVLGHQARSVKRQLPEVQILSTKTAKGVMDVINKKIKPNGLVFGFGNLKGLGADLLNLWEKDGEPHGL